MMKKKSLIFVLVAILGFPQIALAESLIKASTILKNSDSIEITEDNLLLTQRRLNRSNRRRRARQSRRTIYRPSRRRSGRSRRRARRRGFRNSARRVRTGAGAAAAGLIGVGVGAAIADSIREDEAITEAVILNEADTLDNRDYYDDYYETDFDQGGYYDSGEFDSGGFDDGF